MAIKSRGKKAIIRSYSKRSASPIVSIILFSIKFTFKLSNLTLLKPLRLSTIKIEFKGSQNKLAPKKLFL